MTFSLCEMKTAVEYPISWALWCKHCLKWIEVSILFVDFYDVSPSCFTIWICALLFASPLLHCTGIGRSWQSFCQCYRPERRWAKQLICEHCRQICKSWSYKASRRRANRGENNFAKPFSSTFKTYLRQYFYGRRYNFWRFSVHGDKIGTL